MLSDMQVPIMLGFMSKQIGPAYADADYNVVFDDLDPDAFYFFGMENGHGTWSKQLIEDGTHNGIKLTYIVNSKYMDADGNQADVVRNVSGATNPTEYGLLMVK